MQAASNKRKRGLDAEAEAQLQAAFQGVSQPSAAAVATAASDLGLDAEEVEKWCAGRKIQAVMGTPKNPAKEQLIDLTGTPSAADNDYRDIGKAGEREVQDAPQHMEEAGAHADVGEHASNEPMEGVEATTESLTAEDAKEQGSSGVPQGSDKRGGTHAAASGTADAQTAGQTSSSSQQAAGAAAITAALSDRPKLLSELQAQIEDIKDALGQELLLPCSISAQADGPDTEGKRMESLAPEEVGNGN